MQRYPLANDVHGNPIELPPEAAAWRVRAGGGRKGRPRMVFDGDTGKQLEVPLGATLDDLEAMGCGPDRYRLEAIDGNGRLLPGVVAFTELGGEEAPAPAPPAEDSSAK